MNKIFYILWFFVPFINNAQYNELLTRKDSSRLPGILMFDVDNLSFIKDNEYFNLIADGYTLFGHQAGISLKYKAQPNYQFTAGLFALKYFGTENFEPVVPFVGLEIKKGNSRFYFGKLYTDDFHQLSGEIYAFERLLDRRRIEHGLQHRFKNTHWQTDTWLEWEHFIHKGDNLRERLNFGQTTTFRQHFGNWRWKIPLQIYLQHRGGQINVRTNPGNVNNAIVIANTSIGLSIENKPDNRISAGVKYQYFRHDINTDNPEELLFKSGYAHKMQIFVTYKHWQTFVAYWDANRFVAPKGDDMFQTVSRRVEKYTDNQNQPVSVFKYHTEPHRRLISLTATYQNEIFKNLNLAFVLNAYYQLNRSSIQTPYYHSEVYQHWDYALGLYLQYRFDFKIMKPSSLNKTE